MDILRSKKRGFFSVSQSENQGTLGKKKIRSSPVPVIQTLPKRQIPAPIVLDSASKDDLDSSDVSTNSSTGPDTGSSCDEINKASKKQRTFAKKSIQREQKKEREKMERKEKNKLSMDDFLLKQIEFHMWLEEEKNKKPKEMSSPKKKTHFKNFIKLWNKKKLPLKYYRGSAETDSPCPSKTSRTFSFAEDDDEDTVVTFKRPKPKRLSIEPCGFLDSPFSTFGKTPPKQLAKTGLQQLDEDKPVMCLTSLYSKPAKDNTSPLMLGDYQEPLNAVNHIKDGTSSSGRSLSSPSTESSGKLAGDIYDHPPSLNTPNTTASDDVKQEPSPVYAVPWKSKEGKGIKSGVKRVDPCPYVSPPPPPVPPKPVGYMKSADFAKQVNTCTEIQVGNSINEGFEAVSEDSLTGNKPMATDKQKPLIDPTSSITDHDPVGRKSSSDSEGWQPPVTAKPFSPPLPRTTTYISSEKIYDEIPFFSDGTPQDSSACLSLNNTQGGNSSMMDNVFDMEKKEDSEHAGHGQCVADFSFSKYFISAEKTNNVHLEEIRLSPVRVIDLEKMGNSRPEVKSDTGCGKGVNMGTCIGTGTKPGTGNVGMETAGNEMLTFLRYDKKRKPVKNDTRFTMKITDGHHNSRNFAIDPPRLLHSQANKVSGSNNTKVQQGDSVNITSTQPMEVTVPSRHQPMEATVPSRPQPMEATVPSRPQPMLGSKSPRKKVPDLGTQGWQLRTPEKVEQDYGRKDMHGSVSENRVPKRKPEATSQSADKKLKELSVSPDNYLETDIDSAHVPIMGSKTPPRQRKPLMSLQRSKSMETIIW